ncbi:type II toxin-antitoxin system RelE/ParE family toxin [Sphingomonas sp. 37zxx]|uniref:type II toxin-antitoxin system RelE/ParE family toxin n=1 Tax=Sphingomonas sp. 37zxx TaxID=1550073 RepID=UPI00053BECBA|nr:type II toxin-antitoxin system RelE/ParE family toxin [Sphingomonas sp. 37zxx]
MAFALEFSRRAAIDLKRIRTWVAEQADSDVADGYLKRILDQCAGLTEFPFRGTPRLGSGEYRSVSFERTLIILYRVRTDRVTIVRILHGSRDNQAILG